MKEICTKTVDGAGGPAKLAAALSEHGIKITPQAISQWSRVPAERVLDIERVTGISRYEQRPDIFGPAPDASTAAHEPAAPTSEPEAAA